MVTLDTLASTELSSSQTTPSPAYAHPSPTNPPQSLTMVRPNNPELEATSRPFLPSSNDLLKANEDKKNVFGDILNIIDDEEWFDWVVNQTKKKKNLPGRSVPTMKGFKEYSPMSSDSNDRLSRQSGRNKSKEEKACCGS